MANPTQDDFPYRLLCSDEGSEDVWSEQIDGPEQYTIGGEGGRVRQWVESMLPPDLPSGEYSLRTGMYSLVDGTHSLVLDTSGQPISDLVELGLLSLSGAAR